MNGMTSTLAPATPGLMGPPSRPVEKATDAAELTDILASSGINVKEEEAYLTHIYTPPAPVPPQQQRQQPPPLNTSFTSQISTPGPVSASTSFEVSPPKLFGTQETIYSTEPASQPSGGFKDPNEPTREDTQAARRAQYHLQDPFLLTKALEKRLRERGFELGVRIPSEGLYHPVVGQLQPIEVTGPDGSSIIRSGQAFLNQEGAPLVDVLTLMSLCCEERVRTVVEYASGLAKSRRLHSHGVVPAEWKDIASPISLEPENNVSPKAVLVKRTVSRKVLTLQILTIFVGPSALSDPGIINSTAEKYRMLVDKDMSIEDARATKRARRNANAILGDNVSSRAPSVDMSNSGPATPTGDKAPGLDKKGVSKKEAKKQLDSRASEAQQHQQSIETARMATNNMMSGRMFGSNKTYSWLNRGTPGASSFSSPRVNTSALSGGTDKSGRSADTGMVTSSKRLGDWREDKEKGSRIQIRDILFMLEQDGRGLKHVQKAYVRDLKEDRTD